MVGPRPSFGPLLRGPGVALGCPVGGKFISKVFGRPKQRSHAGKTNFFKKYKFLEFCERRFTCMGAYFFD